MSHIPPLSFKVAATLPAYRIVTALTGTAQSVKLPANATELPFGITVNTVLDIGLAIPVAGPGSIAKLAFNDSVASGAYVAADSGGLGLGVPHVNVTAGSYVIGVLVGPSVQATGTIADVFVLPHFKSIP